MRAKPSLFRFDSKSALLEAAVEERKDGLKVDKSQTVCSVINRIECANTTSYCKQYMTKSGSFCSLIRGQRW